MSAQFNSAKALPVCLFVFSLVFYSPVLFLKTIENYTVNGTATAATPRWKLTVNEFGGSFYGKMIPIALSIVRLCLATLVLFVVNLITACKFNSYFRHKSNRFNIQKKSCSRNAGTGGAMEGATNNTMIGFNDMSSNHSRSGTRKRRYTFSLSNKYNVTLMVIVRSFLYSIGTVPFSVYYIFSIVCLSDQNKTNNFSSLQAVLLTLVHVMYSFDFFIYYFFNRLYRMAVNRLFKWFIQ
jgi:hypothetical protein